MTLAALLTDPITVLRAGTKTDRAGNTIPDWANTTSTPASGSLQQTASTEVTTGRDTVITTWQLFLPYGTDIQPTDRVQDAQGNTFEVADLPAPDPSPRKRLLTVRLRLLAG